MAQVQNQLYQMSPVQFNRSGLIHERGRGHPGSTVPLLCH